MYTGDIAAGLQWPCSGADDPGAPQLYASGFRHGKAQLQPVAWHPRPQRDAQFPLMLAHGRVLAQHERKPNVVVVGKRNRIEREEQLVLNPDDAAAAGLADGRRAVVVAERGAEHRGVVAVSDAVPPGVVSLTTLFGELAVEVDASERPDPMNHIPRLNAAPARIAAAPAEEA